MKEILEKINRGEKLQAADKVELMKAIDDAICKNHTGKMSGMWSISTSVLENKYCQARRKVNGAICQKCYAARMAGMYHGLEDKLSKNTGLLTTAIIPMECMPTLLCLYFRFESFGDLNNEIQVINYFNMCRKNKSVRFALWTKNPGIVARAIKAGYKKPSNLNIIYSSPFMNDQAASILKLDFIDKVFTVYDQRTIENQGIEINCGARSCAGCLKCYKKNKIELINEKLK